jgi:hypothetical protein
MGFLDAFKAVFKAFPGVPNSRRVTASVHLSPAGRGRFAHPATTWFETRGVAALLTMRVSDLILRRPPQAGVSKE